MRRSRRWGATQRAARYSRPSRREPDRSKAMAICEMQLNSLALERPVPYTLILPDSRLAGPGPYAVLVQLHGYWDDQHAWIYKSNLALYVERLPLIVVLPNGENGYWINWDPARH